ncbi:hypothetical protein CVT24_004388 [Panaeolus cyanescens]|uniref:Tyrosinase copper-binding domain-containing protein n=1 Tax=Panaeolus cyanescens TaxID=181874 RepID=A0A409VD99_9AGAR|nr:hypothetical protein CVT24_004388 [Panaeolus cyanescens]
MKSFAYLTSLLLLFVATALAVSIPTTTSSNSILGISNTKGRKEWRELTDGEKLRFIDAFKKLQMSSSKVAPDSVYDVLGTPQFLPWHRSLIRQFELELQRIDQDVTVPYWNWTIDYSPETSTNSKQPPSSVLSSDPLVGLGTDGAPGPITPPSSLNDIANSNHYHGCVQDGAFISAQGATHCILRGINTSAAIKHLNTKTLAKALEAPDFESFRREIEGPRNTNSASVLNLSTRDDDDDAHIYVGREQNSFGFSPLDPLFYLHHTFVDLIWNEWEIRNPNAVPVDQLS